MNDVIKTTAVLAGIKFHYNKDDPNKKSGISLRFLTDPYDVKTSFNVALWFNNDSDYNLYLTHQKHFDDYSDKPDNFGYFDLQRKAVEVSYKLNDKNYKNLVDLIFLDDVPKPVLQAPPDRIPGTLTAEEIEDIKNNAKFTQANKLKPPEKDAKYPDWEKIAEGKVRHGVVVAFIESGEIKLDVDNVFDLPDLQKKRISTIVKFIIEGR